MPSATHASQMLFAHVVGKSDDDVELDVASLLVAEWEYPEIDIPHYVGLLDGFADRVRASEPLDGRSFAPIRALNRVLFGDLGFRGNQDDYYDPRNSFLHEVIDRRTGIPITLSIVYIEVARRLGFSVRGVSFPGHFLCRYDEGAESLIIDPYRMGLTLDIDDLETLLERVVGPEATLEPAMLLPAPKKKILLRMLTNLAGIYSRERDALRSLEILERMHIIEPDNEKVAGELARLRTRVTEVN